jgi:hypothetical protein
MMLRKYTTIYRFEGTGKSGSIATNFSESSYTVEYEQTTEPGV